MRLAPFVAASLIGLSAAASAPATRLAAQDVEMWGERYGTRPPPAYFEQLAADPDAFRFGRGRTARLRARMDAEAALDPDMLLVLGPRDGPVLGAFRVPVLLGLFSDSPDSISFGRDVIQAAYFGAAPGTITDFYDELSGGRAEIIGDVIDWTRASFTRAQATGGESGLEGTAGAFITKLLERSSDVDWALYDNDGPDGLPNSGDDDGYVDALAVIQPTEGAECGGEDKDDLIWSHRWALSASVRGDVFTTTAPAFDGGFIRVDDYFIQPVLACQGEGLNPIGVISHELGHAFGLPDLYDTDPSDGRHAGAGNWALMASGSFGCDNRSAESPCHMSAWTKSILGWADITTVPPASDVSVLTLDPVETGGPIYRIDALDGSGEYFLLENRQRIGYDQNLYGAGLLVWHVDPDWVSDHWANVNATGHRGVWLRQADGRDDLGEAGGSRGDSGDPFPYVGDGADEADNDVFHAGSLPAATSVLGTATGLTLLDIVAVGERVQLRLLNRLTSVTLTTDGGSGSGGLFTVDGASLIPESPFFTAAPFDVRSVEAARGLPIEAGVRRPFVAWADDPTADNLRDFVVPLEDIGLVAQYSGRELELAIGVVGGAHGVAPGVLNTEPETPDLWFEEGTQVTVEAVATTGFDFVAWTGAFDGQSNPATIVMAVPIAAQATFALTYAIPPTRVDVPAATLVDIHFEVENGNDPVSWTRAGGELPEGLAFDSLGRLSGWALELGSFPMEVVATDLLGLVAAATITLEIGDPGISLSQLASRFLAVGDPLTSLQEDLLDNVGNRSGGYDLGDFRAWMLANPQLPFTAALSVIAPVERRTIVLQSQPDSLGIRR